MHIRLVRYFLLGVIFALSMALLSCGGNGGPITPDDTDPRLDPPGLHEINVSVELPGGSPLQTSDLKVLGFFDSQDLGNPADVLSTVTESNGLFILSGPNDSVLGIAYVTSDDMADGNVTVGVDAMAQGVILLNPFFLTFGDADKKQLIADCMAKPEYQDLKNAIQTALIDEPENATNPDVFPDIYKIALQLGWDAMVARAGSAADTKNLQTIVGPEGDPHLEYDQLPACNELNPKMCFYGVGVENSGNQQIHLIAGKSSWFSAQWGWPPIILTPPESHQVNLTQGTTNFIFEKGGDIAEPGHADIHTIPGRATYANVIKMFVMVVGEFSWWLVVDNHTIADIVDKLASGEIPGASDIDMGAIVAKLSMKGSVWEKISGALDALNAQDKFDGIFKWIWGWIPNSWELDSMHNYFTKFTGLLKAVGQLLKVTAWANEKLPFCYDLVTAPKQLGYTVNWSADGVTVDTTFAPPDADFSFNPVLPKVGEQVTFDASASSDDETAKENLQFRWDFDCDGFDTDWSTSNTASFEFPQNGPHNVCLEVMDEDNKIGELIKVVYVTAVDSGGTSNHVKIFMNRWPWDSTALTDLLNQNGCTEGQGEFQYEIFNSSMMADVIMSPGNDMVIIVNDQDQTFYNDLSASLERFVRFIENGGTILWEACDMGWGMGSMQSAGIATLPGGVTFTFNADHYNYIVLPEHPLVAGLPEQLYGNYASHEYFGNLVAGSTVYTVDSDQHPTLLEYDYQDGHILLTGQPLEAIGLTETSQLQPRIIRYVFGLDPQG